MNAFCNLLISGLVGTSIHVPLRHRWTGLQITAGQIGLLGSCHGLLRPTYFLFVVHFLKVPAPQLADLDTWGQAVTQRRAINFDGDDAHAEGAADAAAAEA